MREVEDSFHLVERETRAYDVKQTAKRVNKESRSNGGLMRIAPIGIWMAEHVKDRTDARYENLKTVVKADIELTHPDKLTQQCCFLYCSAIAFLLNNPKQSGKGQQCFDECLRLSQMPICNYKSVKEVEYIEITSSCESWLREAQNMA